MADAAGRYSSRFDSAFDQLMTTAKNMPRVTFPSKIVSFRSFWRVSTRTVSVERHTKGKRAPEDCGVDHRYHHQSSLLVTRRSPDMVAWRSVGIPRALVE